MHGSGGPCYQELSRTARSRQFIGRKARLVAQAPTFTKHPALVSIGDRSVGVKRMDGQFLVYHHARARRVDADAGC